LPTWSRVENTPEAVARHGEFSTLETTSGPPGGPASGRVDADPDERNGGKP
jgi:hypothetical protein